MAGLLRDDFSPKRPITQVPTAWFNAVAKILNGITAGVGININKNGTDTAGWEFELDLEFARKYLGIEGGGGKPTDLTHEDITDWDDATADFLTQGDLDGYATEADVDAVSDLVLDLTDVVDGILADYVSEDELTTTLSFYSNTETIANTYATKTDLSAVDDDLTALAQIVDDMDADLADLLDWADALDADLYDANGARKFVTTNTAQTITGTKTFSNGTTTVNSIALNGAAVSFSRDGTARGRFRIGSGDNTDFIIEAGNMDATTGNQIRLYAAANKTILFNAPTATASDTSSKAVATCGWAANLFSPKTHNHDGVYSKTDHTHSGYATTNHTHSNYATTSSVSSLAGEVDELAGVVDGILAEYVAEDELTATLSAYSNTETIAANYATKTALSAVDDDLTALAQIVDDMDADLGDLSDWADALDADLYDANGSPKFVTTNTAQTVTGTKTFKDKIIIKNGGNVDVATLRTGGPNALAFVLENLSGGVYIRDDESENGVGINFEAAANKVVLKRSPTATASDTTSKAVATCGWAANLFSPKTHNHDGVYAKTDHTHSGYASTNHTHSEYATTSSVSSLAGEVDELAGVVDGILADYVAEDELTTTLSAYSNTETIAANYATKTALAEVDGDLADLADYVADMDADLGDLTDWADALDADLYDAQGAKKWVDTSTTQTIGGSKTFTSGAWFRNSANVGASDGARMNISSWSIEMYAPATSTYGGFIDFHNNGSNEDWTSRVIDDSNGLLLCTKKKVRLTSGSGYYAELDKVPADDSATTSGRIATLGWVNNYFSRKTHHHDDVYAKTDHTHTGYATTNHTHTGYATTGSVTNLSNALTNLTNIVNTINENYVTQDALTTKLSVYSTTEQISGAYVTKASFNSLDAEVGEIEADLADIIADLDDLWDVAITTDDISQAFINATRNGQSGSFEFVTNVAWTGSALTQTKRTVTVTNGLITNLGSSGSASTIDNAVLFEVT